MNALSKYYERIVLGHPAIVLFVLFVVLSFFAFHAKDFKLDASADSLILEDDKDLKIFREVNERYSIQDFLVVTFSPSKDLFSKESFGIIEKLQERLKQLERVDSVITVFDVPLLRGLKLSEISPDKFKTLKDPAVDVGTAKQELVESPIYGDLLISEDGETTALIVNLRIDKNFSDLLKKRNELLAQKRDGTLTNEEDAELGNCLVDYERSYALFNSNRHQDIERIRSIIRPYEQYGVVRLGGVPMIADDMITFIKKDLTIFGFGVFFFIVLTLTIIFREIRWVVLPLLSCFFAVSIMIGMLGFLNWKVTVISSNFISLMLILTMSMNIHLTVRYRQLCGEMSAETQKTVVGTTVRKMVWPSLYCALTTILGFSSLVFSNIRPVIDFGWMMTIGLSVTFGTSFLLFPAALMMLQKSTALIRDEKQSRMTSILAAIVERHGGKVIVVSLVLAVISVLGITKLKVENSFINYFSKTTEIYQGMKLIDEKLGGTNPLDVIIKFEGPEDETAAEDDSAETEDAFDGGDEFGWVSDYDPKDYWFTPYKIAKIKEVHDYLDGLPEVGKVLSLASMVRAAEGLNEGKEFDSLELSVLYKKIPDQIRATMVDPF
ncbi:MAG: MMPL family transporter, partial [Deltaproteobacteria bacterium]|nr:MMPL family transporter [Deltaproteobacteria bacterium]